MVQAWYQGGVSVFDWTDVAHPKEIAYFDRGPIDATRLVTGGAWSAYWYNGVIVSSEIARGLDIYELVPSGLITENEIAAAKTVKVDVLEHAGPAAVRLAAELRAGARVPRSAGAIQGSRRRHDRVGADGAWQRRAEVRRAAQDGADRAGGAAEYRRGVRRRSGQGAHARDGCHRSGQRALNERGEGQLLGPSPFRYLSNHAIVRLIASI